jgi:hypothetical protein
MMTTLAMSGVGEIWFSQLIVGISCRSPTNEASTWGEGTLMGNIQHGARCVSQLRFNVYQQGVLANATVSLLFAHMQMTVDASLQGAGIWSAASEMKSIA